MTPGKEFRSRMLALNPLNQYLNDKERYIYALPTPKYRINVLGAGMMGLEHMATTMFEGRAIIHGLYDPNPRSVEVVKRAAAAKFPQVPLVIYPTLEAACQDPNADALIISSPNYTHIDVVREAVKSKKHILLEKPMATTIPDAWEITQLARHYPAVFQIGLQYRYKAMYVEAIHEALERKAVGEIKFIQIHEHRIPFLDKVKQWNKFSQYSGGTMVEKCCHYFDLLNLFAHSRPVNVYASGSMAVNFKDFVFDGKKSDILDNAFVTIEYANGIRAGFTLCMFAPQFYEEIVICGDEGRLKAFENQDMLPIPRAHCQMEILRGENQPSRVIYPTYPQYIQEIGHDGASFFEHVYFIDNIEGKPTNTATPEEGFWSIVVGVAAEESVHTGEKVHIPTLLQKYKISI